ncbi:SpaA isopeptide-forming pilin-related protein [Ligilactobacillus salivarius]|uniref:SpaA isopeptide-forming pilin-related protein n=1 Tax=Ligilactobacillus salivarius TaxID=1624 RepID=UPI0029667043|nr:SpaA isopeptide-forming pilin-related protein [Ligilactobacillus salivarius]MDW3022919.1 SpaA isopeptide-forming pilin-related protein [Ligilactobacillus salivarius]
MKLLSKKLSKKLLVVAGMSVGVSAVLLGLTGKANAAEAPQTVNVGNSSKIITYGSGHAEHYGPHEVAVIKDTSGNYLFCIEWSKRAPSNEQIAKRYQASPSVQWLVNNFYSGHRYQSLGQGDEGDYWLYQAVIHWVADPNDHYDWGGTGAIQDVLGRLNPSVRAKVEALRNEALKHNDESSSEIVTNNHNLAFDPSSLEINKDNLQGNTYKKTFTLKSENMSHVKVWLKNAPSGVTLTGKDGAGVNFNDVWNNTNLQVNIPYRVNAEKDSYNFTVATKGNWEKTSKVAWIYSANDNSQKVAKQDVKAVSVPLDAETDMNVTVKPAKGSIQFIKKGSANNNSDVLANTEFTLTGGDFKQVKTTDKNGYIKFDNLPLGRDYELNETKQPNSHYKQMYHTTINNLNGDNPVQMFDLKTVTDINTHKDFYIDKKDVQGNPLKGAQFVIVRNDNPNPNISPEEAKKTALRKVGDELVEGHGDQEPYIATTDGTGRVNFNMVLLPNDRRQHNYYAVEIKSPDKYTLSQTSVKLVGSSTSPISTGAELKDTTNPLPATGSEKLLIVAVGGIVLVALGGGALYFKQKVTK